MNWYLGAWKKYAEFKGRARRQEFWTFILINFAVVLILKGIDVVLGTTLIYPIYFLAVFTPVLAVTCRRLHDTDRSGWMQLLMLIPLAGWIVMLVFLLQDGQQGDNRFGPDPKA